MSAEQQTKFTPDNWSIKGKHSVMAGRFIFTPHWRGPATYNELEANANLIASAPELYAALVGLVSEVRKLHSGGAAWEYHSLSVEQAERAISKALGNSSVNKEGE